MRSVTADPRINAYFATLLELEGFGRTKGSLHFTPEAPLPPTLFEALVKRARQISTRVSDLV